MVDSNYQTYLKIIAWEDFFELCNCRVTYRKNELCSKMDESCIDKACAKSDKETMLRCPVWKKLRNFYSSKLWSEIKNKEVDDGRYDENGRCQIAQRYKSFGRQQSNKVGRFQTDFI
jgi:hypothetical protein